MLVFICVFIAFVIFTFLNTSSLKKDEVFAYETSCPDSIKSNLEACYEFLLKQSDKISDEQNSLKGKISDENYQQLTLSERISYYNNQIATTENKISKLEVDIETKNVQIKILGDEISEIQNNVNTISQEVNRLENSVDKRISLSYRYSFVTPIELFLETTNFESFLRRMKYLIESRKKDKELLNEMVGKSDILKDEEDVLAKKQEEVQKKRTQIEEEKTEMFEEKENLSEQKTEYANLLAVSKRNEAQYQATISELQGQLNSVTAQVSKIIMELYKSGQIPANTPVKKGDIIGFQGHTGFAAGSHVHFELNYAHTNPFSNGYFSGSATPYSYAANGSAVTPVSGARVGSNGFHGALGGNYAVDFHSTNQGDQSLGGNNVYYQSSTKKCLGWKIDPGYYRNQGEGAPVRAIKAGKISQVLIDICGGKYTIIDHGGGVTSLYLHLR